MLDTTKKYVMYLRKSRHDPDYESASVEDTIQRHRTILETYAKNNGLNVVEVYREVASAESISQRPEMMRLLGVITEDDIEGILCMDIDRLARGNSIDQGIISQTLQYTKTKIITPYKIYDPQNEFDEEYMEFGLFMSRKEYKIINRRLERGRKISASEGRFMGACGPYGYEMVKLKGEKGNTLKIIPEQAEIVKKVYDLYCNHGYGYIRIRNFLNEMAIPAAKGGKWSDQTVRAMLHNVVYAGYIRSGYKPIVKKLEHGEVKKHRVYNRDCEIFPGKHEAIITKELFDKAQSLGAINTKNKTNKKGTFHFIFSGLMFCKDCEKKLGSLHVGHIQSEEGKRRVGCKNSDCKNQCSSKVSDVEKVVKATLKEWLFQYNLNLMNSDDSQQLDGNKLLAKTEAEIKKLLDQREKICELLETGVYDIDTFKARDLTIQSKLQELNLKKEKYKTETNRKKISREEAIPKIQHLLDAWDTISPDDKNYLLKQTISHIVYNKPKGEDMKLDIYPNF